MKRSSNRNKDPIVDYIKAVNIDANVESTLLDLFEYTMKSIARTLACEATFEISDYESVTRRGCEGFILRMRRLGSEYGTLWSGEFTRGDQRLSVSGHLE